MPWVVDEYSDRITEKSIEEAALKEFLRPSMPRYKHVFDIEWNARAFVIQRASEALDKARLEVKKAAERLRKCEKKFGSVRNPPEAQPPDLRSPGDRSA